MSEYTKMKNKLYNDAQKLSGKAKVKAIKLADDFVFVYGDKLKAKKEATGGVITRRGGGIAKRGMGIAK